MTSLGNGCLMTTDDSGITVGYIIKDKKSTKGWGLGRKQGDSLHKVSCLSDVTPLTSKVREWEEKEADSEEEGTEMWHKGEAFDEKTMILLWVEKWKSIQSLNDYSLECSRICSHFHRNYRAAAAAAAAAAVHWGCEKQIWQDYIIQSV